MALALFVAEMVSGMTIALSLACGCVVAMLLSFAPVSLEIQIVAALITAGIVFVCAFVIPNSLRKRREKRLSDSNIDALIGRTVQVIQPIKGDGSYGRVKIDGDLWQALTEDDSPARVGEMVEVVGYESIVLIVKKKQ